MQNRIFGSQLKLLRNRKGISQDMLAEQLNLSQSTLARIEVGQSKLDSSLIPKLCQILEIEIEDLFKQEKINIFDNNFTEYSNGYVEQIINCQKDRMEQKLDSVTKELARALTLLESIQNSQK